MKRIITLSLSILVISGLSILPSCKGKSESKSKPVQNVEKLQSITKEIQESVYPLPTSAEVIKMLTELEVGYIIGISNSVKSADSYFTSKSRAINLGIYGADLSYATLYNMQQDVINYLDAIRKLAGELNMAKVYDESLYESIKDNFDNRDELVNVLTGAFNDTYSYLSENDQQALALLVVGGAWVEGMYLTTNVSESVYHVKGIVEVLLEQKRSFELFLDVARPYSDNVMIKELLETLKPLSEIYSHIDSSLSLKNVEDITKAVAIAREKLVTP